MEEYKRTALESYHNTAIDLQQKRNEFIGYINEFRDEAFNRWCTENDFIDLKDLAPEELHELAIPCVNKSIFNISHWPGCNGGRSPVDYSDRSDSKIGYVRNHGRDYRNKMEARISGIENKEGLRITINANGNFYHFCIPRSAYGFSNKSGRCLAAIDIPFNMDFSPKFHTKWWRYQKKSFKEMSMYVFPKEDYLGPLAQFYEKDCINT
jgi:hypothetical protein